MKSLYIIALAVLVSVSFVNAAEQEAHLFILSGQSNMLEFNPNTSFIPALTKEFGEGSVIVVKDAEDGQPILRWHKKWRSAKGDQPKVTGDLYDHLLNKVNGATKGQQIKTITFIWMQGEQDGMNGHGEVYETSLKGLIDQLRIDLKRKDMNFVIGRLSDYLMENPDWLAVRRAQVKVAESDPRGAWVDTDGLNGQENGLHYTKIGYKELGRRFAQKAIALINASPDKAIGSAKK